MANTNQQDDHATYMQLALIEARKSPPNPSNFCVGACLVTTNEEHSESTLLATGYTLECEGNTHAEQCCFLKLAGQYGCNEEDIEQYLPEGTVLYTTMEPCNKRSVGNLPCVDRISRLKRGDGSCAIEKVYVGVKEPESFVGVNEGRKRLEAAGIQVIHVLGLEEEILKVATAGHSEDEDEGKQENG